MIDPNLIKGISDDLTTLVEQMPTRRDLLAGMAMHGLIVKLPDAKDTADIAFIKAPLAEDAVLLADALLAELDKEPSGKGFEFPVAKTKEELPDE